MKVTFLGTSHGVPEVNRRCTSILLTVGKAYYIIDAGVPLFATLRSRSIDPHDLKAIFLTHMHGDHSNGLIEFVDLLTWHDKDVRPSIWVPEIAAHDAMAGWLRLTHGKDVQDDMPAFSEVKPGAFYDDGVLRVTAIDNDHLPDRPSYSYLVEAEGKRLVFTGDMGHDNYRDFPKAAMTQTCDLVVSEAAHCLLSECEPVFSLVKTKKLVITHIVPRNEPEAVKLNAMVPYPVKVAFDGMEIEL